MVDQALLKAEFACLAFGPLACRQPHNGWIVPDIYQSAKRVIANQTYQSGHMPSMVVVQVMERNKFTTSKGLASVTTTAISNNQALTALTGGKCGSGCGATVTQRGCAGDISSFLLLPILRRSMQRRAGAYTDTLTNLNLTTYYVVLLPSIASERLTVTRSVYGEFEWYGDRL